MFGFRKKSALLIDFDNVLGMTSGDFVSRIPHWLAWLEDGGFDPRRKKRRFAVKRVYWNPLYERYRPAFEAAGFEAFACRAIAQGKKSSADIVITLDAMDVAAETKGLKEIVLLTSDTDFVPVVNRLQTRNLDVAAIGNEANPTAAVYREYADLVVLRSALVEAFGYERKKARAAKAAPAPAKRAAPARAGDVRAAPTKPADSLELAAERIVRAAKGALGAQLSRQSVTRALADVPGFSPTGANPWLGCGSYKALLRAIAQRRRKELRLFAFGNGGVCVAYAASDGA